MPLSAKTTRLFHSQRLAAEIRRLQNQDANHGADRRIYLPITCRPGILRADLSDRLAGARDFRDFSCLPPAKENRVEPADPAPAEAPHFRIEDQMASDETREKELKSALSSVINTLQDSQKGFADIGEHLKDDTLKRYFLAESIKRANFRAELENELHRHGVKDVHETGTTAGTLHRVWGDLKAKVSSSDHTLLETAEQGEDVAKKAYQEALDKDLPLPVRQLLTEQQAHILTSHDYVKRARDERKS